MASSSESPLSSRALPQTQGLGEVPSIVPDVPINSAFLALFIMGATAHLGLYHFNRRRGRSFAFSAITSAFCITRIIATSLRMGWAVNPNSVSLSSSTEIFVYAGVVILILSNLFFAQRFVRAQHPKFGWRKSFSLPIGLWALLCCIAVFLLIVSIVVQAYLHDAFSQQSAQEIQLFCNVIFTITAILPIPIVGISSIAKSHPSLKPKAIDNFGRGSLNRKMVIIFFTATILSIGAIYRASITLMDPILAGEMIPWYFTHASFYIFNFTLEFLLITLWLVVRIDEQFIIPDGSNGPMTYGNGFYFARRSRGHRSPIDRASTIPTPSLTRPGSWGTLRNYMTDEGRLKTADSRLKTSDGRLKTPVSRLQTPISRPEMIHNNANRTPASQKPTISSDRYLRTRRSRGNSFWNSSVTAASLSHTAPSIIHRTDSAYDNDEEPPQLPSYNNVPNEQMEDIRKFPIAITDIDLRRATAAALRAAAAEQEAAIYSARTAQWSDLNSRRQQQMMQQQSSLPQERDQSFDVRSLSCYSVRSDMQAFSPRLY